MKKTVLITLFLISCGFLFCQNRTSTKKDLPSANLNLEKSQIDEIRLNPLPKSLIEDIISQNEKDGTAYQVSESIPININTQNSGTEYKLENSAYLWILKMSSTDAKSVILKFDRFDLPEDAEMYVYCNKSKIVLGPYTKEDNKSGQEYAIGIIPSDELTIEYYTKTSTLDSEHPDFQISSFDYFFRGEEKTDENESKASGSCNVNVNCPEGANWQTQKKGVCRIIIGGYYCTGTLINNTSQDGTPYILFADHCVPNKNYPSSTFNTATFDFYYESTGCPNTPTATKKQFTGASHIAHGNEDDGTDFLLVKLTNATTAQIKSSALVYNGWDRGTTASTSGVGIHHPAGDIKKISTYTSTLTSSQFTNVSNSAWKAQWVKTQTNFGITEGGSSGSPLFNNNQLVVGTLSGGESGCGAATSKQYDLYGKMSYHWNNSVNGSANTNKLQPWLDPKSTGATTCPLYDPNNPNPIFKDFTYDFESCTDFAIDQFSPCTTYDGDGLSTYTSKNFDFPNEGYTGSFIAFNPSKISETNGSSSWAAHGGNKYGACFNAASETQATNDWFILPKLKMSANTIFSFWAKSVTADYGLERFKLLYSYNDYNYNQFSEGDYIEAPTTWTKYSYSFANFAGNEIYIAIRCVSLDSYVFMIDDISVTNISTQITTEEHVLSDNIFVYPNPNNGEFSVNAPINAEISIYDIMGKLINRYKSNTEISKVNLHQKSGMYFVEIKTEKTVKTEKIIIE